ncbi:O-antigen ligase [Arthrobacter sp. Leaf137]|uniref:O-antigen ligase family protein n=1 Tax=Arthrobacter sp. Leaf137 TaxID=1736271 RepID=UPI0009E8E4DC|nr:O-antigen ligase family protein [Arthrobacter sp. Leaf137]
MSSLIRANSLAKRRSFTMERVLAFAVIASIPVGPILSVGISGRGAHVSLAQLLSLILLIHLLFSKLASFGHLKSGFGITAALSLTMGPPLVLATDMAPAAVAYFNYATGVIGGIAVGYVWSRASINRLGLVDLGLVVFLVAGGGQLIVSYLSASSVNALHQNAQTPWGNSNYAAACLVVGSFVLLSRGIETRRVLLLLIPVLVAVIAALLTLSRGAAISLAVGLAVLLWTGGREAWQKAAFRLSSVVLPFLAYFILNQVEDLRYQGSSHANSNIESRFILFDAAWRDFLSSPIIGNGWVSFREISASAVEEQSFAHNLFLSFLQIGGVVFGLSSVIIVLTLMVLAIRRNWLIAPAVAAAFTISMSDPFFESTVANLLVLSVIFLTLGRIGANPVLANEVQLSPNSSKNLRTYFPGPHLRPTRAVKQR